MGRPLGRVSDPGQIATRHTCSLKIEYALLLHLTCEGYERVETASTTNAFNMFQPLRLSSIDLKSIPRDRLPLVQANRSKAVRPDYFFAAAGFLHGL